MGAVLSPCGTYRYSLTRDIQPEGCRASVVMVNPSTADAIDDDPTIRKVVGFGKVNGWAHVTVVNKFAFRATDVNELRDADNPIGPFNDEWIMAALLQTDVTLVAWGRLTKLPIPLWRRWRRIKALADSINRPLLCLGVCGDGHPKHPLMPSYTTPVVPWEPPDA